MRNEKMSTLHAQSPLSDQKTDRHSNSLYKKGNKQQLEQLIEEATNILDSEKEIYRMSIKALRHELQQLQRPQILDLFQNFSHVDYSLNIHTNQEDACHIVLEKEYDELRDTLTQHLSNLKDEESIQLDPFKALHHKSQALFLEKKIQAIETIYAHYDWKHQRGQYTPLPQKSSTDDPIDTFGYKPSDDKEEVSAIRHHQMLNLTKSTLLRHKLGYSVLALQSTVPTSGRGIYLDGFAAAGSLLAFFPGPVWTKEHLLTNSETVHSLFKQDPNYMLSLRYDDILIDSRKAPYTVLSHLNSNPFCIAHIANHPPKYSQIMDIPHESTLLVPPNCHTVMVNFTQGMNLKDQGLSHYLPNTYARSPQLLGPHMFDQDTVCMHGMGLLASRDICDEELFYDYRLSPTKDNYPPWYSIIDEADLRNRWFHSNDK
jgi:hypothetical protein